ncbi:phage protein NinX family protein [Proteus vulgaris]
MNKYTELSDFEINKKVAESLKLNTIAYERTEIVLFDDMDATPFDPCNNPTDAMPIIIENGININFNVDHYDEDKVSAFKSIEIYSITKNIYRSAMEVFLMMRDAERETNT